MDLIKGYTVPIYKDGKFITHSLIKDIESIMTNFLIDLRNTLKDWLGDLLPIDNIKKLQKFNDSIIYLINANLSNARCKWAKIEVKLLLNKEIILTKNSNIFDAYNKLPSDTRPGFNTSSLIIHQISTSALAYAIATHDGKLTTEEIQLLRTGCLFHDIGKPFIWAKHAAVGAEKFQEFFGEFFTDDYLQKILLLIKGHMDSQQKRDTRWYIHHADILSASSDRLTIILSKLFGDHFPWMKDPTEFRKFERWNSIKNNFGKMTDEYVNNYTKIFNELFKNIPETEGDQIGLVIGDIRKIKTYVDHVNRVAELKGASSLVDEILQDVVISLTQEKQIPPENIIFFGGGNIFFICDGKSSKELTNFIEIKFKESFKGGLRLTAENYKIDYNYKGAFGQAYTWLMLKLNKKKKELKNVWTRTLPGAFKLCQSCGIHLAEKIIIFSEGEKDFYCESCIQKFEKGRDPYVGFAALWKPFAEKLNYPWRAIREKLLEFIAGHTIEDIEKMKKKDIPIRRLDVAVIKADGNLMGEFMADSASLTDLIERNIRIDRCMDIVFQEITSSIKNLNNIQIRAQFTLGKIYVGGDDLILLCPSWISIPIALNLIHKFYYNLGGLATLSVGLATMDPKFPIWVALEACEELLSLAKEVGRKPEENKIGSLNFTLIEGGSISAETLKSTLQNLKDFNMIHRPYKILLKEEEFFQLFRMSMGINLLETRIEDLVQIFHKQFNELSIPPDNYIQEMRRKIIDILTHFKMEDKETIDQERILAISQTMYKAAHSTKRKDSKFDYFINVFNLLEPQNLKKPHKLLDALHIIKIAGGGLI